MAAITDGTFTSPVQDGDKQVTYPFDFLGDAYARMIVRPYVMLSSSYSAPRTLTTTSVTNYLQRSEQFDNAYWTATAVTITADNAANPNNGALTADRLMETAVSSGHNIVTAVTLSATPTTVSIFAKANGRDWLEIAVVDSAAAVKRSFFDLTNGVVGTTSSNTTSAMVSVGNGWYRVSQTWTSPAAGLGQIYFELSTNGSTVSYLGDTSKGVYLWGAQWENASSLGTYLPTTSATRTSSLRTRDIVDNSGDSGADYFAFLCQETPPDAGSLRGGIARLSRTYMRVPAQQVDYGSAIITRPVMNDIFSGSSYAVSFEPDRSWVFTSRKTASFGSATISVTGQTSTETFTTSDTEATIRTACNTATTGGGTNRFFVTKDTLGLSIFLSPVSLVAGTNDIRGCSSTDTAIVISGSGEVGGTLTIRFADAVRTISCTSHGGSVGQYVVLWNGDKILATGKVTAQSTNAFTAQLTSSLGPDAVVTHCQFAPNATCYVNGPVGVSTKEVTDFYYPGWSPGITTPQDITTVASQIDPVSWLGLIVAGTAYGVVQTSDLTKYNGGPFYSYTTTYAQMSDALETVSASA